jgi:hypothetical protein
VISWLLHTGTRHMTHVLTNTGCLLAALLAKRVQPALDVLYSLLWHNF